MIGVHRHLQIHSLTSKYERSPVDAGGVGNCAGLCLAGGDGTGFLFWTEHNKEQSDEDDAKADKYGRIDNFLHAEHHDFCFRAHRKPPDFVYYSVFGSIGIYDRE